MQPQTQAQEQVPGATFFEIGNVVLVDDGAKARLLEYRRRYEVCKMQMNEITQGVLKLLTEGKVRLT